MTETIEQTAAKPRIILDCDPGIDDSIAIAVAAAHTDIVGITTVGGNVDLEATTANALAVCDVVGIPDVEVHQGHDMPLGGSLAHRAAQFHGPRGTGDIELPESPRPPTSTEAVDCIIETVRAEEGLWLVPIGPLTNIADAFQKAPDIVDRVHGISWMGGSSAAGNVSPAAEFNCWVDPEAADIVFRSEHPNLRMSGLNVTTQMVFGQSKIDQLRVGTSGTPMSVFADLLDYYAARQHSTSGRLGAVIHDVFAVVSITHPHLVSGTRRFVEVVVAEGPTRGMTLVDQRPRQTPGPTNTTVFEKADAETIATLILETLGSKTSTPEMSKPEMPKPEMPSR